MSDRVLDRLFWTLLVIDLIAWTVWASATAVGA
jgi:hypothetical protein